jgi:Haem-NO-binding
MRGVVFTEFLDFIDDRHGYPTVDAMLELAAPASGGIYTAIGRYDFSEMAELLGALSHITKTPQSDLLQSYGRHLFMRFAKLYPVLFKDHCDALTFLASVDVDIRNEFLRLYPNAELPDVKTLRRGDDVVVIEYRSRHPLGQLCVGLIQGCGEYFGADLQIDWSHQKDGLDITVQRLQAFTKKAEARP